MAGVEPLTQGLVSMSSHRNRVIRVGRKRDVRVTV